MKITRVKLQELTSLIECDISHEFYDVIVDNVSSIHEANQMSLTFFNGSFAYLSSLSICKAKACIVKECNAHKLPNNVIPVLVRDPYFAITQIIHKYIGDGESYPNAFMEIQDSKICKTARISSCAKIGKNVTIMPYVYIGADVEIQDRSIIHSHASLEHCTIGENSVIRSGVRVGSAGFGFVPNLKDGNHLSVPQISRVIIGNSVDIGVNSCIDRGFLTDTKIGHNTKIDNIVHVAHGVEIGESCFIAGCVGIAGSAKIGNFCMIGGHSSISNLISIADYTQITARSGVIKSIQEKNTVVSGFPSVKNTLWKKMQILLMKQVKK